MLGLPGRSSSRTPFSRHFDAPGEAASAPTDQKAMLVAGGLLVGILAALASLTVEIGAARAPIPAMREIESTVALFHNLGPHLLALPALYYAVVAWTCMVALWIVYLGLVWRTRAARTISLRLVVAGALTLSFLAVFIPSSFSSDIFSYAIFGRIASVYGTNPYLSTANRVAPNDALMPYLYWRDIPSPYGPLWTLISQAITFGKSATPLELTLRFKVLGCAAVLLDGFLIYQLVKPRWPQQAKWAYLAFAWNPLVLVEGIVAAHNDALILSMVLAGAYVLVRTHSHVAFAGLTLSALVKYSTFPLLAVVTLPTLRATPARKRPRLLLGLGLITVVVAVSAFAPYWAGGRALVSTAAEPGRGINNPLIMALRMAVTLFSAGWFHLSVGLTSGIALAAFAAWQVRSLWRGWHRNGESSVDETLAAGAETLTVFLVLWPRIHTWYFLVPLGLILAAGPLHRRLFWGIALLSVLSYCSYML
jgi:hypothetical protein